MKLIRSLLLFLVLGASAHAASLTTYTLTFTNTTANGYSNTINGTVARFTNAPANSVNWITTGSSNTSATNFFLYLGANFPALASSLASSNIVTFRGIGLTATITGPYGTLTSSSSTITNQHALLLPFSVGYPSNALNDLNEILSGLNTYSITQAIKSDSTMLTNFVGITNAQTLARKVLTNAFTLGGTNVDSVLTNAVRINTTNMSADTAAIRGGTSTNVTHTGSTYSGTVGALTGGSSTNQFGTNWQSLHATNIVATGSLKATNATIDGLVATNFSAPGSGADSQQIGASALANAFASIALGVSAVATNTGATALGYGSTSGGFFSLALAGGLATGDGSLAAMSGSVATNYRAVAIGEGASAYYPNSVALGALAIATTSNQVRLGTSAETVSIPGELRVDGGSLFANHVGSNYVSGRFTFKAGTVTSLVNGNNAGIALGTNQTVELSGGTTIAQIAGFAATGDGDERLLRFTGAVTNWVVNESGSAFSTDATAANRIVTGTGGDLTLTNQPAWIRVRYRGTSSRWEVTSQSR